MIDQERNERLWKACGFIRIPDILNPDRHVWKCGQHHSRSLPKPDDLNALFRWAVSKVREKYAKGLDEIASYFEEGHEVSAIRYFPNGHDAIDNYMAIITGEADTPGKALFLACEKALGLSPTP